MEKAEVILMFDRLLTELNCDLTLGKLFDAGVFVDLDDGFYENFTGQCYQGLPVNYVLRRSGIGYGINAAEALTLALGPRATLCSGYLEAFDAYGAPESAMHDWVEIDSTKKLGYVVEPTWGLAMDKSIYYNVFGVDVTRKEAYATFIKARQKNPAAVNLYTREDYEERGVPLNPHLVQCAQEDVSQMIRHTRDQKRRAVAEQLLTEFPDLTKCRNLVKSAWGVGKRLTTMQRFAKKSRLWGCGDMLKQLDPTLGLRSKSITKMF